LGIIFGVAAVIAMLAIGNGAQKEIIDQIKLVGLNNIVIKPIVEQKEEAVSAEDPFNKEKNKYSPGLTLKDKNSIADMLPDIQAISPEIVQDTYIMNNGVRRSAKLVGVEPPYFKLFNFELEEGHMFNEQNLIHGMPVCIIGKSIKAKFFPSENPIGKKLKCGNQWLTVMGVLEQRIISENSIKRLGIRDYNMDVYVPLKTVLIRYENRDLITKSMINNADTEKLSATADIIARMLARKHFDVVDYEIEIPELLLKQQQRTNDIFNYVLGAIAGISLLVGGIGIMNIMLASVLERIKEIGLRLSIGAKKTDIVFQFMFEAIMISATGGIIGIFTGILMAYGVSTIAKIPTLISFGSIFISFGVATLIGLIFGIAPARKAAQQNPITSLRYE
jgi:putative ABC transport system permease protein